MSRYIERLIEQVRRQTENEDFSSTTGISTDEFIDYFNDAQHRLQSVITATHPKVFTKEIIIDAIANQESYSLPVDSFMDNMVTNVEYSTTGDNQDYYLLDNSYLKNRDTTFSGFPVHYIRVAGKIMLNPAPSSAGKIRLWYVKRIDELDLRRGKVNTAIVDSGTNTITTLGFDPAGTPALDTESLNKHNYICIADKDGVVKMANIPFDSIDSATGVVTVSAGFTFEDGETLSAGDYVVGGQDTTTHSELPRMCERYLKAYVAWKILKRDSSIDYSEQQAELLSMEQDVVNSYADIMDDVAFIPSLNSWDY